MRRHNANMNAGRHSKRGFTLTELLISLAILAMLTGVAIPAVMKINGFLGKKSEAAARDLYGELRAARMSAISSRNDIAVIYAVDTRPDNYFGGNAYVVDGYGMATRATQAQIGFIRSNFAQVAAALNSGRIQEDDIFILAKEATARFRPMPRETAVIGHLTAKEEQMLAGQGYVDRPPASVDEFVNGYDDSVDPSRLYEGLSSRGMRNICLFQLREADDSIEPVNAIVSIDTSASPLPNVFPAHVFLPTGELSAPGSSLDPSLKERITIDVGPAPDASLEDRFTVSPQEGTPVMAAPTRIEVYRSTGRVVIN